MGYCIEMTESNFVIKKENFQQALNSLKQVFVPEKMTTYDCIYGKKYPHFKWVRTESVLDSRTLIEALSKIRYNPVINDEGDIVNVEFCGEKYGDENIFFSSIAKLVEPNSFLKFRGEDGAEWIWLFYGEKVKQDYI